METRVAVLEAHMEHVRTGLAEHFAVIVRQGYIGSATTGVDRMAKKITSSKVSTLASKVLSGSKKPTAKETKSLAASVLSQDEKKGQRGK